MLYKIYCVREHQIINCCLEVASLHYFELVRSKQCPTLTSRIVSTSCTESEGFGGFREDTTIENHPHNNIKHFRGLPATFELFLGLLLTSHYPFPDSRELVDVIGCCCHFGMDLLLSPRPKGQTSPSQTSPGSKCQRWGLERGNFGDVHEVS
jgi:hypothetical protein